MGAADGRLLRLRRAGRRGDRQDRVRLGRAPHLRRRHGGTRRASTTAARRSRSRRAGASTTSGSRGAARRTAPTCDPVAEVDGGIGCCMMYRREAALELGGYDPRWSPVWFDDLDLTMCLRREGLKVFYLPDVQGDPPRRPPAGGRAPVPEAADAWAKARRRDAAHPVEAAHLPAASTSTSRPPTSGSGFSTTTPTGGRSGAGTSSTRTWTPCSSAGATPRSAGATTTAGARRASGSWPPTRPPARAREGQRRRPAARLPGFREQGIGRYARGLLGPLADVAQERGGELIQLRAADLRRPGALRRAGADAHHALSLHGARMRARRGDGRDDARRRAPPMARGPPAHRAQAPPALPRGEAGGRGDLPVARRRA